MNTMNQPIFNADSFVRFDLTSGAVSSLRGDRLALLPTQLLAALPVSDEVQGLCRDWGRAHGRDLAEKLEKMGPDVTCDPLAEHLGCTLAALGFGRVSLHIRQDALLLTVESQPGGPVEHPPGRYALQGFVAGYLEAVSGHPFVALPLGLGESGYLLWVGNPTAAHRIQRAIDDGIGPMEAVDVLMTGGAR
jgi:hypothetical protein